MASTTGYDSLNMSDKNEKSLIFFIQSVDQWQSQKNMKDENNLIYRD